MPTSQVQLREGLAPGSTGGGREARPVGQRLAVLAIGETQAIAVSVAGAVLCTAAGLSMALGAHVAVAALLFSGGAACDLLDGAIARRIEHRTHAKRGAVVDSICDKVGEGFALLGFGVAISDVSISYLILASFVFGALTSYLKAASGEHRLQLAWPEARIFGRGGRAGLIALTLLAAVMLEEEKAFVIGFGILLIFNCVTFVWRMARVARALARFRT